MSRLGLTGPSEKTKSFRVMCHPVVGSAVLVRKDLLVRRELLVRQDDLYAAVLLPAAFGAIVRDRVRRAVADCLDARRIDAAREQSVANCSSSPLGEQLIRRVVANRVRVTFDANR